MKAEDLRAALEDPDRPDQAKGDQMYASALMEGVEVLEILLDYKDHENPYIRASVAIGLGYVGKKDGGQHVYDHLKKIAENDPENLVRGDAIMALGEFHDPRTLEFLAELYPGLPNDIKNRVLFAIKELNDRKAIPFLEEVASGCDAYFLTNYARELIEKFRKLPAQDL